VLHSDKEARAIRSILNRACTDLVFRERLLNDPRTAILETFGVAIPPTFHVKFVERAPGVDALIVLPDVAEPGTHTADAALDSVSGGTPPAAEWPDGFLDDHDGSF
jgi:hypothetical protein